MIEEEARYGWSPIFQNRHEPTRGDVGRDIVAKQIGKPKPIERGANRQFDVVDDQTASDGGT
jgi:hypothetical protein